jgi:hypothetical protein
MPPPRADVDSPTPGTDPASGIVPLPEGERRIEPPDDRQGYGLTAGEAASPASALRARDDAERPPVRRRVLFNEEQQFTLGGLMLLVTLVGLLLGPVAWLPLPVFAGMLGLGALTLLALISVFQARLAIIKLAWWLMLLLYVTAAAAAYIFS